MPSRLSLSFGVFPYHREGAPVVPAQGARRSSMFEFDASARAVLVAPLAPPPARAARLNLSLKHFGTREIAALGLSPVQQVTRATYPPPPSSNTGGKIESEIGNRWNPHPDVGVTDNFEH